MYAHTSWGEEKNQWLIDLSFTTAAVLTSVLAVLLLIIFRVPVLRVLAVPIRPFAPILTALRVVVTFTPLRHPCRRYLYVGRHLNLQEA